MKGKIPGHFSGHTKGRNGQECHGMTRRDFLKATGIGLTSLALPLHLTGCPPWEPVLLQPVEPPEGTATVSVVRKSTIEEMVQRAVELAGGLDEINQGDTVVIKPNLTSDSSGANARIHTHPEVLRAVIKEVKTKTHPGNITVAEASALDLSTLEMAQNAGIYDVVQEEGANFLPWDEGEYVPATSAEFKHIDFMLKIPRTLADASFDHFINVPVLKNHEMVPWETNVDYTCCIKNHVGVLQSKNRRWIHTATLGDKCAELNLAVPKHAMNVVDALTIILTGGPWAEDMDTADAGLILASKDRVACDSLAVAVLRHYASEQGISRPYVHKSVWEQAQIRRGQELNLGRYPGHIQITDEDVNNIAGILDKWS